MLVKSRAVTGIVTDVTARRSYSEAMAELKTTVTLELEAAGRTLLALPMSGYSPRLRTGGLDFVREAIEAYGWQHDTIRPAAPSAAAISRMDAALAWLSLIPPDRTILRRIVGSRALVHPITDRHLFSWRRLGSALNLHHETVKQWHVEGVELIVTALASDI